MEIKVSSQSSQYRPLRIWIPIVLVAFMVVARYVPTWLPEIPMVWMVGAFVPATLGILIMLWWLLLSRATWIERVVGIIGVNAAMVGATLLMDETMLGPPIVVLMFPLTLAAFAISLICLSQTLAFRRTSVAVLVSLLSASFAVGLKNDGATGDFSFGFAWRWQPTPEEQFLADRQNNPVATAEERRRRPTEANFLDPQWPGFRGPHRDGIQRGIEFSSDWQQQPPQEQWRVRIGPAWSSFAVADSFLVTQEQRGESEAIVCYDGETGDEVWAQEIKSRFFDALGGLGPRSTPTIDKGFVYALGAEGWMVKLAAASGEIIWQVDLRELTKQPPPMWGYSCSPLVFQDLVIVHAAGIDDKGVVAFDSNSGGIRWSVATDKDSYSSLHLTHFFDQPQLVFLGSQGAKFFDPLTGDELLTHDFKIPGYRALQPAVVDSKRLLFTSEYAGARLIELQQTNQGLESREVWTSRGIKPDFNDLVVHDRFAYGFDGSIFTCLDLSDGKRRWKKGRYGKGQVILLADSELLLVVSEKGELVLLEATPDEHREIHKLQALDGKTWNHPVVVEDRLYLRNATEAVCYRLPTR